MANRFDEPRGYDRGYERERTQRTPVSRDFMTNEPRYREYGEMAGSWNERSPLEQLGRDDIRGARELDRGDDRDLDEREFAGRADYGRSRFDESIAGRPGGFYGRYEGSPRVRWDEEFRGQAREREGWRGYGSTARDWSRGTGFGEYRYPYESSRSLGYAGRGPKGYKRSDERIHEEVCEVLTRHPEVDASEIEVRVKDGEITLTGTVEDRRQKRLAEDAIEDLPGVRDVNNQVRVRRGVIERMFGGEERKEETGTRKPRRAA